MTLSHGCVKSARQAVIPETVHCPDLTPFVPVAFVSVIPAKAGIPKLLKPMDSCRSLPLQAVGRGRNDGKLAVFDFDSLAISSAGSTIGYMKNPR